MSADARTADRIVEVVEDLMMTRGFNAISYHDVSERIGIRKASVHYHFPTKADLGEAVIKRYADKMAGATPPVDTLGEGAFRPAFETFLAVFFSVAASPAQVCLGGVLGAEFETLPDGMRREVKRFYAQSQGWLAAFLEAGRAAGAFDFRGEAEALARAVFSALEGALIIGRALGEPAQLEAAADCARGLCGLKG